MAGPDELPVQCVGPWAKDKHDYLVRYFEATAGVRKQYLPDGGRRQRGGAAFIDLFAGPGRARVRTTGDIIAGSPLLALETAAAPFTHVILADLADVNTAALRQRTAAHADRTTIVSGDCNATIDTVTGHIPQWGLNLALLDPYGLRPLEFSTIRKLAAFPRMDLILHFPTSDIQRNFSRSGKYLTAFLGTDSWKVRMRRHRDIAILIDILREQFAELGYTANALRSPPVWNTKNRILYHLVYASKHDKGNRIWESIARTNAAGQRDLGF